LNCLYPEKNCPFAKQIELEGKIEVNCLWECPFVRVFSECPLFQVLHRCPYVCIYQALDPHQGCPLKEELQKYLEDTIKQQELSKPYLEIKCPYCGSKRVSSPDDVSFWCIFGHGKRTLLEILDSKIQRIEVEFDCKDCGKAFLVVYKPVEVKPIEEEVR